MWKSTTGMSDTMRKYSYRMLKMSSILARQNSTINFTPRLQSAKSDPSRGTCLAHNQAAAESYVVPYVKDLDIASVPSEKGHVSARSGWAGETSGCFSILLVKLYGRRWRDGRMHRQGASGSPCLHWHGVFF